MTSMLLSGTQPVAALRTRDTQRQSLHRSPLPFAQPLRAAAQRRSQRAVVAPLLPRTVAATATEGASAPPPSGLEGTSAAAGLLRTAAEGRTLVPKREIFKALQALDKQRLKGGDEWYKILGGEGSPGRRWRLIYTVGKEELEKERKGQGEAQGKFFPLTAAQRYDPGAKQLENGVFLGHVAALTFLGPHDWQRNKLVFNFWKLNLKLGPWKLSFDIKRGDKDAPFDAKDKGLPFFVFFYIDEHIAVAKGRGGGWAYWARTDPKWDLEHGIV